MDKIGKIYAYMTDLISKKLKIKKEGF